MVFATVRRILGFCTETFAEAVEGNFLSYNISHWKTEYLKMFLVSLFFFKFRCGNLSEQFMMLLPIYLIWIQQRIKVGRKEALPTLDLDAAFSISNRKSRI